MENNIKNRKNQFLAFLLSILMVSSTAAAFVSCTDNGNTSEDTTSEETTEEEETTKNDTAYIKNGNFITNDVEDETPIVTSVSNWSRSLNSVTSGSAPSSKAASGVVDLSKWDDLTGSHFENPDDVEKLTESQAIELWDDLTTRDKLAYYEVWEDQNDDGDIDEDFEKYESFNIDIDDVPTIAKFGTHYSDTDADKDDNVLMIHNLNPETDATNPAYKSLGTAQKYTSSSTVTIPANASARFSVWVRTQDLTCTSSSGETQEAVGKGAYISVTHSVGGKSMPAYEVKNINTETMDEANLTNGWAQYTFYVKGSSYANTTFSLVLGLGQGGGTDRLDYVNGYAFFDDIECDIVSNDVYSEEYEKNVGGASYVSATDFTATKADKTVNAYKNPGKTVFGMDFYGEFQSADVFNGLTVTPTASDDGYTSIAGDKLAPWLGEGLVTSDEHGKDVTECYANKAAIDALANSSNKYLASVYGNHLKDMPFDAKTLLLLSIDGAAYTAETNYKFGFVDSNGTTATDDDVQHDYIAISFFVKTSDMKGFTGGAVTLVDGKNETAYTSIDTSDITAVEIGEDEDVYKGWQQYFFFVKNDSDKDDLTFSLKFNFGPTTIDTASTLDSFHTGFAAFTNFRTYYMSKQEYDSVSAGTYAKVVSVTGTQEETASGNKGFDSAVSVSSDTHTSLEKGLAQPANYKGVISDSAYITGIGSNTAYSDYANAGLLNREYFTGDESYFTADSDKAWMKGIQTIAEQANDKIDLTDTKAVWASVFENATQPLFIWNDGTLGKAYGFFGSSTTVSASTYTAVSVRVKVGSTVSGADPVANVYLIDTETDSRANALSIGRNVTYWYDKDGNILSNDPDEKGTIVALELQKNGLYKIADKWAKANNITDTNVLNASYANLAAYEVDPVTKDKLVAEGGASHAYEDYWKNEGEDGIAYYYRESDGKYCADKAETLAVTDLSELTALKVRYGAVESKQLMATVGDTNGEWATVTFYIHTGELAKNYRLEVWSGDRTTGAANAAGTYVMIDTNNPGTAEDNFTKLLEEYENKVTDDNKIESVFSYYDSANYLRYNAELDKNGVGDVYADNISVSEESGIAYLHYAEGDNVTVFADYSYTDKTVPAVVEDDDNDTDTDTSTSEEESEMNPWLLASSIAIAAVLVLAIASIAIRKIMENVKKNRGTVAHVAKPKKEKKVKAKKASKEEKEEVDEESPYND